MVPMSYFSKSGYDVSWRICSRVDGDKANMVGEEYTSCRINAQRDVSALDEQIRAANDIYLSNQLKPKYKPVFFPKNVQESGYCNVSFSLDKQSFPQNITISYCTDDAFTASAEKSVKRWIYDAPITSNIGKTIEEKVVFDYDPNKTSEVTHNSTATYNSNVTPKINVTPSNPKISVDRCSERRSAAIKEYNSGLSENKKSSSSKQVVWYRSRLSAFQNIHKTCGNLAKSIDVIKKDLAWSEQKLQDDIAYAQGYNDYSYEPYSPPKSSVDPLVSGILSGVQQALENKARNQRAQQPYRAPTPAYKAPSYGGSSGNSYSGRSASSYYSPINHCIRPDINNARTTAFWVNRCSHRVAVYHDGGLSHVGANRRSTALVKSAQSRYYVCKNYDSFDRSRGTCKAN